MRSCYPYVTSLCIRHAELNNTKHITSLTHYKIILFCNIYLYTFFYPNKTTSTLYYVRERERERERCLHANSQIRNKQFSTPSFNTTKNSGIISIIQSHHSFPSFLLHKMHQFAIICPRISCSASMQTKVKLFFFNIKN